MSKDQMLLVFVVTEDWYFCSHRLGLARAAKAAGYDVHVVTQLGSARRQLEQERFTLHPIRVRRASLNPIRELSLLLQLARILFVLQPDLVHNVSLKPVLYSSFVTRLVCDAKIVNALTGLGFVYSSHTRRARMLRPIVQLLLRLAFATRRSATIFQNEDDQRLFVNAGVVAESRTVLIRGSGVDPDVFHPVVSHRSRPVVALPARLLREKGVYEFIAAARLLAERGVDARFVLVGEADTSNRGSVTAAELALWKNENVVELWGWSSNMASTLGEIDIVVLPSYRGEGVPKSLLEGASCGLPIVTTRTPGCQDVVQHGLNGFLVPMQDSSALADAIQALVCDPDLRRQMGARGRQRIIANFSESIVVSSTLGLYAKLLNLVSADVLHNPSDARSQSAVRSGVRSRSM